MVMETDVIGFIAGGLVAGSIMPKLLSRIGKAARGESDFDRSDFLRDAAQAMGNLLWVYVGLRSGLISVTLFCLLSFVLLTGLIILNLRGRAVRRPQQNTRASA
jgi:hypothetical protein